MHHLVDRSSKLFGRRSWGWWQFYSKALDHQLCCQFDCRSVRIVHLPLSKLWKVYRQFWTTVPFKTELWFVYIMPQEDIVLQPSIARSSSDLNMLFMIVIGQRHSLLILAHLGHQCRFGSSCFLCLNRALTKALAEKASWISNWGLPSWSKSVSPIVIAGNVDGIDVGGVEVGHKVVAHGIVEVVLQIRAGVLDHSVQLPDWCWVRLLGEHNLGSFRARGLVAKYGPVDAAWKKPNKNLNQKPPTTRASEA